jgi:RHS repeat-associated protein
MPLGSGADVAQSSAWRGRWVDITGFYDIGLRPYEPVSGRWLTYDSVWNERDPNYYTFAGGEPIMRFDADGRITSSYYANTPASDYNLGGVNIMSTASGNSENQMGLFGLNTTLTDNSLNTSSIFSSGAAGPILWSSYVFSESADVRLNVYDPNVLLLDPNDVEGRIDLKLDARAMTPQPISGYLDAAYPDLGPQLGSFGSANVPNATVNQTAVLFGRVGNGLMVVGAGINYQLMENLLIVLKTRV